MIRTGSDEMYKVRGKSRAGWLLVMLLLVSAGTASAQNPSMDIYGFAMLDMGHNFKTIHPDWFDTMRVQKLPSFEGEFGQDNSTFASVRQTRFGVKANAPTALGELKTTFEFEMFGVGADAGQTTIRLRHAFGEVGQFGAGQTWSPFMDPDVFPNSLEYWGPTGMVFYRNVQVRWMPLKGNTNVTIALERPGAAGDTGRFEDNPNIQGLVGRYPAPDVTGQVTHGGEWGYVRAAGAYRRINWDDNDGDPIDLSGHGNGWGINLSSNLNFGANKRTVARLQFVFGEGIQNYMNDNTEDVALVANSDPNRPFVGELLPLTGVVAFLDHKWAEKWSTSIGYSRLDIDNVSDQTADAFKTGEYALVNLLHYPVPNVMVGGEFQWGRRENFGVPNVSDGFASNGYKLQFSFRYNFSHRIGG